MEFVKMSFREELAKVSPKLRNGADIYIWGAGYGWSHIKNLYKIVHNINLENFISAFVDNDPSKHGTEYYGKKVISPEELDRDNAVVLVSLIDYQNKSVEKQLLSMGFFWRSDCFDRAYIEWILVRYSRLQFTRFKDRYNGERCFIIGNGPSLKTHDLDRLQNEITFASNHIYLSFDKTSWRPSYYVVQDDLFMEEQSKSFCEAIDCVKFFSLDDALRIGGFQAENAYYFGFDYRVAFRQHPYKVDFSNEPGLFYWCSTVTYTCLQLAAYMGFKEIYLLGVDCDYSSFRKADGEIIFSGGKINHFHPEYVETIYTVDMDLQTAGYQAARDYVENNGLKIYNATRGGKLEVFERVDFDQLFN